MRREDSVKRWQKSRFLQEPSTGIITRLPGGSDIFTKPNRKETVSISQLVSALDITSSGSMQLIWCQLMGARVRSLKHSVSRSCCCLKKRLKKTTPLQINGHTGQDPGTPVSIIQ